MQNENSRNTIIFFVCAALIMGVYYFMVMRPQAEMRRQQPGKEHPRDAQPRARDRDMPEPDARQHDGTDEQQIMGDGRGFSENRSKNHTSLMAQAMPAARTIRVPIL